MMALPGAFNQRNGKLSMLKIFCDRHLWKRILPISASLFFLSMLITKARQEVSPVDHQPPRYEAKSSEDYREVRKILLKTDEAACKQKTQWGGSTFGFPMSDGVRAAQDGNYTICLDPEVRPASSGCLVYSFGIHDEWSFDEAAERNGCEVFSFDPSMMVSSHKYSDNITFLRYGLSNFDGVVENGEKKGWEMRKLSTFIKKLKHENRIIDVLKIDIEESEHDAFPEIIQSGVLRNVRQVVWESHNFAKKPVGKFFSTYKMLEEAGFKKFYAQEWDHVSCITENEKGEKENYCFIFSHLNKNPPAYL